MSETAYAPVRTLESGVFISVISFRASIESQKRVALTVRTEGIARSDGKH
jgi:hypothetical protein